MGFNFQAQMKFFFFFFWFCGLCETVFVCLYKVRCKRQEDSGQRWEIIQQDHTVCI